MKTFMKPFQVMSSSFISVVNGLLSNVRLTTYVQGNTHFVFIFSLNLFHKTEIFTSHLGQSKERKFAPEVVDSCPVKFWI